MFVAQHTYTDPTSHFHARGSHTDPISQATKSVYQFARKYCVRNQPDMRHPLTHSTHRPSHPVEHWHSHNQRLMLKTKLYKSTIETILSQEAQYQLNIPFYRIWPSSSSMADEQRRKRKKISWNLSPLVNRGNQSNGVHIPTPASQHRAHSF